MDSKELRRFNILTKPIFPLLVKTSIPTIIGMLISVIYNLTDTFFVGRLNNRAMIAAIGIVFSFVSIITAAVMQCQKKSENKTMRKRKPFPR